MISILHWLLKAQKEPIFENIHRISTIHTMFSSYSNLAFQSKHCCDWLSILSTNCQPDSCFLLLSDCIQTIASAHSIMSIPYLVEKKESSSHQEEEQWTKKNVRQKEVEKAEEASSSNSHRGERLNWTTGVNDWTEQKGWTTELNKRGERLNVLRVLRVLFRPCMRLYSFWPQISLYFVVGKFF